MNDPAGSLVASGAPRDVIELGWWAPDGSLGGIVRLDSLAERGASSFVAAVVGPGRAPVVVIDHELPLPGPTLELRAPGLWVDLVREEPLVRWTVGLEAFGLAVEPGAVVDPSTFGDRVPLGLDLEVEMDDGPARVAGEVLVGDEVHEVDGAGSWHRRGDGDDPSLPMVGDARRLASIGLRWPGPGGRTIEVGRHLVDDGTIGWAAGGQ